MRHIHWRVFGLAWPMILSNLSQPLLGLVDTAILGHLESTDYLAAVAVGSAILMSIYLSFGFLRMGTTGLVAQSVGRGQLTEAWRTGMRAIILGAGLGALLLMCSPLISSLGTRIMGAGGEIQVLAASYTSIRLYSAPAALAIYALIGWFIGKQDTRAPLMILVTTNLLNVLLDLLLIIGLGMNSDGAALATVIAEYSGLTLAGFLVLRKIRQEGQKLIFDGILARKPYWQLLRINRHLFVRTLALLFSFAFFTAQGARLGPDIVAANAILINLVMLTAHGLDGFAHAVEALVGEAVGASNRTAFNEAVASCTLWSVICALLFTGCFGTGISWIPILFTDHQSILHLLAEYWPWLVVLPLITVGSYLLDGIYVGAIRTAAMQNSMLVSVVLVYLPIWWLFRDWSNHGLWLAFIALNLARTITLGAHYILNNRDWIEVPEKLR